MPNPEAERPYWVAVKVVGYHEPRQVGVMEAVFADKDLSKVKEFLAKSDDHTLILFPSKWGEDLEFGIPYRIPPGLDAELDKQVEQAREQLIEHRTLFPHQEKDSRSVVDIADDGWEQPGKGLIH